MARPPEFTIFQWLRKVVSDVVVAVGKLTVFYEFWSNLTAGQKTAVKNSMLAQLDTTISELQSLRDEIAAL